MAERAISPPVYLAVLVILMVLTAVTVGISFIDIPGVWHIILGLTIAVCKASLVVLFFMHVLRSPRVTWGLIVITAFWLVMVFMALTLSDYFTRGAVSFVPGH